VNLVCSTSPGFLIEIESQYHFSPQLPIVIPARANRFANRPKRLPGCKPWRARPGHQGKPCRFAFNLVPVGAQASNHASGQRTNNPLHPNPRPRSRLKSRTIARLESGGAGAHLAARFFPIIHRTPPYFFRHKRPYFAGTRRTSPDAIRSPVVRVFTPLGSRA
jgi:hypothetical protein